MSKKPIIGIIGKVEPKIEQDIWHRIKLVDELRYLVVKNGGIAVMLLPTESTMEFNDNDIVDYKKLSSEEINDLYRQLELCDGFVLQGGLISCSYEVELAKKIIELNKPLIGICAGFNNILRAIGTNVKLDETRAHDHYDINYRHKVDLQKDTMLFNLIKQENIEVNSIHSMVATKDAVEPYATISSYSEDGLVESFELNDKKFVMGIKWHPELMLDEEYVDKIFIEFINSCKNY